MMGSQLCGDDSQALADVTRALDQLAEAVCNPEWYAERLRLCLAAANLTLGDVGISEDDIAGLCRDAHIRHGKQVLKCLAKADWPVQLLRDLRNLLNGYHLELSDLGSTQEQVAQFTVAAYCRSIPNLIAALRSPSVSACERRQVANELMLALRETGQTYADVGCTQQEVLSVSVQ